MEDWPVNSLWVEVELCSVHLVESPEQILGCPVDIVATRVIREVVSQWRPTQLLFEEIDLVEEQNYAGSHEPSGVDNRVEEN